MERKNFNKPFNKLKVKSVPAFITSEGFKFFEIEGEGENEGGEEIGGEKGSKKSAGKSEEVWEWEEEEWGEEWEMGGGIKGKLGEFEEWEIKEGKFTVAGGKYNGEGEGERMEEGEGERIEEGEGERIEEGEGEGEWMEGGKLKFWGGDLLFEGEKFIGLGFEGIERGAEMGLIVYNENGTKIFFKKKLINLFIFSK